MADLKRFKFYPLKGFTETGLYEQWLGTSLHAGYDFGTGHGSWESRDPSFVIDERELARILTSQDPDFIPVFKCGSFSENMGNDFGDGHLIGFCRHVPYVYNFWEDRLSLESIFMIKRKVSIWHALGRPTHNELLIRIGRERRPHLVDAYHFLYEISPRRPVV